MIPIRKNILFKPFAPKNTTDAGLFIPESVQKPNNKGVVVEVGGMVKSLKKGDVGFRVKEWGDEVIMNGETCYIMDEKAILTTL